MGLGSHERNYKVTKPHDHKVIENQGKAYKHVIDASIPFDEYVSIDISNTNPALAELDLSTSHDLDKYINGYLDTHKAKVAYGGYLEVRDIYGRSNQFTPDDESKIRNIHLGVDFWCEAGTNVLAVLKGKVHSFQNNKNLGDYGPTIVLEHQVQGETFYTLYGHLSLSSIENLKVGQVFNEGEIIGSVGDTTVNGDYAPHLHFQIIEDMQGIFGDYPGVSCRETLEFYKDNCPDPNLLIKFLK